MIFYDYLLTPQLFSYTAISRRNTVSCIKYQYRAALQALQLFLVEKNVELSLLGLHPADHLAEAVVSVRLQWYKLCATFGPQRSDAKGFLIMFCSYLFDKLLRQCHRIIEPDIETSELCLEDTEDVYYRFGGSTICSMLHSRYNKIKSCPLNQKDSLAGDHCTAAAQCTQEGK